MSNANTGEGFTRPQQTIDHGVSEVVSLRYHYMDNLRALAMLLGIVFHASLAYSPLLQNLWMGASNDNSAIVDIVAWFSHTFRMPLFFMVSGFFALMLIDKRGILRFLTQRTRRIALPFVIFLPLCIVAVFASIGWAINTLENLSPMLQFIKQMQNQSDAPSLPFSTMHLWFLFNLMQFSLVFALCARLGFFESCAARFFTKPLVLLLGVPLMLAPALATQYLPLPAPERIYPQLWSFGYFGIFFLTGGILFRFQHVIDDLKQFQWPLLLSGLVLYAVFYQYLPQQSVTITEMANQLRPPELTVKKLIAAVLEAYIAWHMTLFCVIAGRRLLNTHNKILAWFSASSYWIYIVHLPILFFLQFLLLDVHLNMWLEFLICALGTLLIGMLSYQILVAKTPLGNLLNGRRA